MPEKIGGQSLAADSGTYVLVWFALLVLTVFTVTVVGLRLGVWGIFAALLIATVKACLVLYFFMRLKYESRMLRTMFFVTIALLVSIIAFAFFDVPHN